MGLGKTVQVLALLEGRRNEAVSSPAEPAEPAESGQSGKRRLAAEILGGERSLLRGLNREDLAHLLS